MEVVFDYLTSNPKLRDIAEVHRGIEWDISLKENRSILISSEPRSGFKKGLKKVSKKWSLTGRKDSYISI